MHPSFRFLVAVVAVALCIHSVEAGPRAAERRQNGRQVEPQSEGWSTSARPAISPSSSFFPETASARISSTTLISITSSEAPSTSTSSHVAFSTATETPEPTSTTDKQSKNPLPIQPKLTPAIGLSGVILLLSGLVYAVIGIKNQWVYVFGSAAYLTALAVSVLIVYLMSPPVSDAVQGAFFVAAFITGVIFGVLSLVFSDITDGFGCLLGGFCLSMWFLSLKDGSLISSTTGRAIFIGCMSAGGYSLSFSRHTRNYGLIGSISFSGATAAMLGIDCLASSGLKEFWLYTWNLNDNVFPLNTNTYPVTKYIKAELAGIVIIAVFGIISQMRVWKLVEEHRASSAAQQLEKQRDRDREEEALGRKIEDDLQKERARWEAAYGCNSEQQSSIGSSTIGPKKSTSIRETELSANDSVEMIGLSKYGKQAKDDNKVPSTTIAISHLNNGTVQQIDGVGKPATGLAPQGDSGNLQDSVESSAPPPPPVVVPLPFTVPIEGETKGTDDNTSVSAVPDSDHDGDRNHRSMSKRVSDMSTMKLRLTRDASREALIGDADVDCDRASSVAATLDDDDDVDSLYQISPPHSPLMAQHATHLDYLGAAVRDTGLEICNGQEAAHQVIADAGDETKERPLKVIGEAGHSHTTVRQSLTPSTSPRPDEDSVESWGRRESKVQADPVAPSVVIEEGEEEDSDRKPSRSAMKDMTLPPKLSKVAQSYRTNEWAKHLEAAEKPSLDSLEVPDSPGVAIAADDPQESSAPVCDELAVASRVSRRISKRTSHEGLAQGNGKYDLGRSASILSPGSISRSGSSNQVDVLAPLPSSTLMGQRESLLRHRVSSQSLTPKTSAANLLAEQKEMENMSLAQRRHMMQQQQQQQQQTSGPSQSRASRKASPKWQGNGWSSKGAPAGFDSHAPKRNSSSQSSEKREQLYAGWREKIRDVTPPQTVGISVEQQRQALLSERRQREMDRAQREAQQQQRASQMDSMMRSGQMLEAHREAMRKMQADANKQGWM